MMLQQLLQIFSVTNWDDPTEFTAPIEASVRTHSTSAIRAEIDYELLSSGFREAAHEDATRELREAVEIEVLASRPQLEASIRARMEQQVRDQVSLEVAQWRVQYSAERHARAQAEIDAITLTPVAQLDADRTPRKAKQRRTVRRNSPTTPTRSRSRASPRASSNPYPSRSSSRSPVVPRNTVTR
ncbi:hypothetical protein B0F90DRAFT_1117035 [Multifurca ochricompacta]|uniref:Uncharacterized protein n=1 Tax=Multifurca ochricompacta TaxID=376703 RepID=A0AAD4LZD9_9AGAM|nr:hypothetical protein B0F90DRAFT_1117035 [Multifurca ochricompacta]